MVCFFPMKKVGVEEDDKIKVRIAQMNKISSIIDQSIKQISNKSLEKMDLKFEGKSDLIQTQKQSILSLVKMQRIKSLRRVPK